MTKEESRARCVQLFQEAQARRLVFYAVNQRYNALLRLPTAAELAHGLPTQEAQNAKVKPTHIIITRADENWNPVMITTQDGRTVLDCWASGLTKVRENFDFTGEIDAEPTGSTRNPGRSCAYFRLAHELQTVHERGEETWAAGSFVSCWDEVNMSSFTSVSVKSFFAMKEPADTKSGLILRFLLEEIQAGNEDIPGYHAG
jgi:hypothetical protein